jgi:hypothetical protein
LHLARLLVYKTRAAVGLLRRRDARVGSVEGRMFRKSRDHERADVAEVLVGALEVAPVRDSDRRRYVEGLLDGYLGCRYNRDGIPLDEDPSFVVPPTRPYDRGFVLGRQSRMGRN